MADTDPVENLADLMASTLETDTEPGDVTEPVETPEVVTEAVETHIEETPAPSETSTSLRDALAARVGALDQFTDDDTLLDYISEGYERASKAPDVAEVQRMQQELEWHRQQQAKQAVPAETEKTKEPEPPAPKWAAPQLSPGAQRRMKNDRLGRTEDGRIGIYDSGTDTYIKPIHAAAELDEISAFIDWKTEAQERIAVDPIGVLKEAGLIDILRAELGLDKIPERVKAEVLAETTAKESAKFEEDYWNNHRNEYLELDEKGDHKTVVENGKTVPVMNAKGKTYIRICESLDKAGLPPHEIFREALQATNEIHAAITPPEQVKPVDKKKAFLDKARESGKKNGHKPVNRVFPTLAEEAAKEDDEPHTLSEVMARSLSIDE